MLNKVKKLNNKGFTIIEVMIVLAIAGLILLIVFLAVPALQRSSRNTQRKTDVGRIGSAVTTIVSNNNNTVNATTDLLNTNIANEVGTKTSYYTMPGAINKTLDGAQPKVAPSITSVTVVTNAQCGTGSGTTYSTTLALKQIAIVYETETGTNPTAVCIDQ